MLTWGRLRHPRRNPHSDDAPDPGGLDVPALAGEEEIERLAAELEVLRLENRILTEAAIIDPATGLPNAAAFDADQAQLHARRRRSEERYSVLLANIDDFHDYGGRSGLPAAHQALEAIALTIKATVREGDRAYRYGATEFAVLLPGADMRHAVTAAERIRSRVEKLAIQHPADSVRVVTVTVGLVEAGFRHATTKEVLAEINGLMLADTHNGPNRILWPR